MSDDDEDMFEIYDELFRPLEEKYGPLDDQVLSSPMLMFGVSVAMRAEDGLYVMSDDGTGMQLLRAKGKRPDWKR